MNFLIRPLLSTCCKFKVVQHRIIMSTGFSEHSDRFNGITVNSELESKKYNSSEEDFSQQLEKALNLWTERGVRAVWFKVGLSETHWVPVLAQNGFQFHHTQPQSVSMYKWLANDEEDGVPPYAHHMVGVAGFVVNDKDEILAVQEKHRTTDHWKLPGGYVDPGENLSTAVVREVEEETGIRTEFDKIICFRQTHQVNFDCSDFYFVCCLKPLNNDINICEKELTKCTWMPLKEYGEHELVHIANREFVKQYLECRQNNTWIGLKEVDLTIKKWTRRQYIYGIEFPQQQ